MQYHAIPYNTGNRSHFSNCFNFQKIYLHLFSGRKVINPIVGADFFLQLRPTQLVAVTRTTSHLKIDHLTHKKLRKNCECCPVSQLIVRSQRFHEFRFSIVRIVVSVSNVTSLLDCLFKIVKNCLNCLGCQKI